MGLRDLIKKKNELSEGGPTEEETVRRINGPEFTFIRSDTISQEIIHPPGGPSTAPGHLSAKEPSKLRRGLDVFRPSGKGGGRPSRSPSNASQASSIASNSGSGPRRLSHRLHLSRHAPESSEHVPENLPEIVVPADPQDKEGAESQWEKRATILAEQNDYARSRSASVSPAPHGVGLEHAAVPSPDRLTEAGGGGGGGEGSGGSARPVAGRQRRPSAASKAIDDDIQTAIRLHEEGQLEKSTAIFGTLANPRGANNPLSQVLYGLALRHGWGCTPDPHKAVQYLSEAAANAASVEELALQAGMKKGGAAKGELVLAIFELANCFRHGWGIPKDPLAAVQYYETAANLGDTDAMNEVAWCYLEGHGCKKDKFKAARYYRQAEKAGSKTLGNSWIWKEKYDPPGGESAASKKK